jgi:N-acetylmuramic acid 6-phosphate etherase
VCRWKLNVPKLIEYRLGILDASEIPPTFSASSEKFVGIIAGGEAAIRDAQEGAEDDVTQAIMDLQALNLNPDQDTLLGIAASGRTPYVVSCLKFAKDLGCLTIGITCCYPSIMSDCGHVDHIISAITGPEVITGSTRLKAGTGTKMVLNMLSTGIMIKVGKTYGNMVGIVYVRRS